MNRNKQFIMAVNTAFLAAPVRVFMNRLYTLLHDCILKNQRRSRSALEEYELVQWKHELGKGFVI